MTKRSFFLILAITIAISLIVLYPTFNLALFGDDWYNTWRYLSFLGPGSSGKYNFLTYLPTLYGSEDTAIGLLQQILGNQPTYYYVISYILRITAAISFLPLTFYLTKNKLASFFAVLFFSVTVIGFDTTNWLINMPVYISIVFFNLFLYFFLLFKEGRKIILFVTAILFFYLAHVASPIRMTGLLIFILFVELFLVAQDINLKKIKQTVSEIFIFILVFLFINKGGHIPSLLSNRQTSLYSAAGDTLASGLRYMQELFSQGRFDFLFYPILIIGKMVIPDTLTPAVRNNVSTGSLLLLVLMPLFFVFLFVNLLFLKSIEKLNANYYKVTIISGLIATLVCAVIYRYYKDIVSTSSIISILFGFYTLIIGVALFWNLRRINRIASTLFIAISWMIMSYIFTWFRAPDVVPATAHRYLIVSAVGLSLFLATIISLGKNIKYQRVLFYFMSILLILQIIATQKYIGEQLTYHGQDVSNKIWSVIPDIPEARNPKQPLVFYLKDDGINGAILHTSLGFGLDYRIALLYNIQDEDKIPIVMDKWQNVVSAVTDGKSFAPYNRPIKPIPINYVYAFRLEGKDRLINITDEVRKKLTEINQ